MPVTASRETKINTDPVTDEYCHNPKIVISPSKLCTFPATKTTIDPSTLAPTQAPAEKRPPKNHFFVCVFNH